MDSGPDCDDYPCEKLVPCKMSQDVSMAASGSASSNTSQVLPEQTLRWAALLYGLLSCLAGHHALCRPLMSGLPMQRHRNFLWVLSETALLELCAYLKPPRSAAIRSFCLQARPQQPSSLVCWQHHPVGHPCCSSAVSSWPCRHIDNYLSTASVSTTIEHCLPAQCSHPCLPWFAGAPRAASVLCLRACPRRPALVRCWPSSSATR